MALLKISCGDISVYGHYDPTTIKINQSFSWESATTIDASPSPSKKNKENPVLSFDIKFDDYSSSSIAKTADYLNSLNRMAALPWYNPGEDIVNGLVSVNLGSMVFKGVITKLETEITGTDKDLRPTRAVVSIEIKRLWEAADEARRWDTY